MSEQKPNARSPGRESTPCDTDRRGPERQLSLAVPDAEGESGSPFWIPGRETGPDPSRGAILKRHVPASWFDPVGIHKVLKRIIHRLPDLGGNLFLTLTINPKLFANAASALEYSRSRIRKILYRLRKGIEWNGKTLSDRCALRGKSRVPSKWIRPFSRVVPHAQTTALATRQSTLEFGTHESEVE